MRVVLFPLFLGLAACAGTPGAEPVIPPDAKAIILANKGRLWKDPDSIKGASIAAPTRHLGFMWHVCVRMNAKNSFGGYTGEKDSLVGIYDAPGKPPEVLLESAALNCDPQPHEPFPELDGGYRPPSGPKRS